MPDRSNDVLLPTLRSAYVRAQSDDGYDVRTDDDPNSTAPQTPAAPEIRTQPENHSVSRTFLKLLSLWVGTIILTASVAALVTGYQAKGILTPAQKSTYNLLSTVLILVLGLSFFEAFKELARHMRDNLCRLFDSRGEEAELIQGFDSLLKVIRLTALTPKWSLRVFCVLWLLINFGAQMLSALINLEVTVDDGHDQNGAYHRSGKPLVSKIDCYYSNTTCPGAVPRHALAHAYGDMTLATPRGYYNDIPNTKQDFQVWRRRDLSQFAHRFNEYNPNDKQQAYPYMTDRIITSASGECIEYDQDDKTEPDIVGHSSATKFTYRNKTFSDTVSIPNLALGRDGTTYIYRGIHPPDLANASMTVCGDRCMYLWVYKNPGKTDGPKFYQCPITVSNVSNTKQPEHEVPRAVARVAAVSIALQGQVRGPVDDPDYHQFQFYAIG